MLKFLTTLIAALTLQPAITFADTGLCSQLDVKAPTAEPLNTKVDQILVGKSQRKMILFSNGRPLKQYHISLGFMPFGKKQKSGDGKTPEGSYKIQGKNPQSRFHLSLRVSYPDNQDIANAKQLGVDPGGDIMIHGFPNSDAYYVIAFLLHKRFGIWTQGCMAVTNKEIEEIYPLVDEGTPIEICP